MASVERRSRRSATGSMRVSWLVRWRDPDGRHRSRSFARRVDGDRFALSVGSDLARGSYRDPDAGKESFGSYAARWLAGRTVDPSSAERMELRFRLHVLPILGPVALRAITPSVVQSWLATLGGLSPTYRKVIFELVAAVLGSAVDDELILRNPALARSVQRPQMDRRMVVPWSVDRVRAVHAALPDRYAIVAALAAGLGLRQGEVFGLSPADFDFGGRRVLVQRQVKLLAGKRPVFALPKGRRTRTVPLPGSVANDVAAYIKQFAPVEVALPWERLDGGMRPVRLLVTGSTGRPLIRSNFNAQVWARALRTAGVPAGRENGCHALRHFYASTLLEAGESVKALSEYLGHADPGFTLRTYTHLMPSSGERARTAVDSALGVPSAY